MQKIKIAFFIDTIHHDLAGTENQLLGTLERLDRERFEPMLVCLSGSEWLKKASLPCPVVTFDYRGFFKANILKVLADIRSFWKREKFDIVQSFFEEALILSYLTHKDSESRPILLHSQRNMGMGKKRPWYHWVFRRLRPRVFQSLDHVLVNAHAIKEFVASQEGYPKKKIKVIYNGVDSPLLKLEKTSGLKEFSVAHIAHFSTIKRHDVIVKALGHLHRKVPYLNFKIYFVGCGEEKNSIKNLVRREQLESFVKFVGSTPDIEEVLQKMDAGVLCSDKEGLSNAILDYMRMGLPVVATNVGGNPELVHESVGVLVEAGDWKGISDALRRLALDPVWRHQLGENAKRAIQTQFSWDKTINETQNFYIDVFSRK